MRRSKKLLNRLNKESDWRTVLPKKLLIEKYMPPTGINEHGEKFWRNKNGELNSFNGQPASITWWDKRRGIIFENWHINGKFIRGVSKHI